MVIAVTLKTRFAADFRRCMVTFVLINSLFYFRMAIETFFIGNFLSYGMALGAIEISFQMGMTFK